MQRITEPELMDEAEQAAAYAGADFQDANNRFCEALSRLELDDSAHVLDLGCGPADIPIRIAHENPDLRIWAVDGADAMLAHARRRIADGDACLVDRVTLVLGLLGALDGRLPQAKFDAVISNSLLHHLHDPQLLWREIAARARPGAAVLVMDLQRPANEASVQALVDQYTAGAPGILRRDFAASLRAAFTPDEVNQQLRQAGLDLRAHPTSDRHLMVSGRL